MTIVDVALGVGLVVSLGLNVCILKLAAEAADRMGQEHRESDDGPA